MQHTGKYSRELYDKEVLFKAVYAFTDCAYIHLDLDQQYYYVTLKSKDETCSRDLCAEFENEIIAQETRRLIAEKTKNIREIIVARAMASTIVNEVSEEKDEETAYCAEEILADWFEENE